MNIPRFLKSKLFKVLGKMVATNIKEQISADLFSRTPFGFPLAEGTLSARRTRGNSDETALQDTGSFKRGVNYKVKGNSVVVSSNGKPKKLQDYFVLGTATIPTRDPFVAQLPLAYSSQTIEQAVRLKAGIMIEKYVDKEISKLEMVT